MPQIMIKCPKTGKAVATGMGTDSAAGLGMFKGNSFQCPACGQMHTWDGKDAFLETGKKS